MKKKTKQIQIIFMIFLLSIITVNPLVFLNTLNAESNTNDYNSKTENNREEIRDAGGDSTTYDPILEEYGGFQSDYTAQFDVIERARSEIGGRDLAADPSIQYDLTVPKNWTPEALDLDVETYHKQQIITDPTFTDSNFWEGDESVSGYGEIYNSWFPYDPPHEYVNTQLYYEDLIGDATAFRKGDLGFWETESIDINPEGLDIAMGEKYQEKSENIYDSTFETNPNYFEDLNNPYGGTIRTGDFVDLKYDSEGFLDLEILPSTSKFGGNPSAAFWHYLIIPYEADYAEMTIEWQLDDDSSFEKPDDYRICSRINDRYIDGDTDFLYGDIDVNGSETALVIFDSDELIENTETISMTYNITRQIDGLRGVNKFDFGAWAKNPTVGEEDLIALKFKSIEIKYNTSDKYEVAKLEFDYKAVDNLNSINYNLFNPNNPDSFLSLMSIYMYLENDQGKDFAKQRVIPFHLLEIRESGNSDPFSHFTYNVSQEYIDGLKSGSLTFRIGIEFEYDFKNRIDFELYFDNVLFTINYKHPDPDYSDLQISPDGGNWENITEASWDVNISDWQSNENFTFFFQTLNTTYQNRLYMNLYSNMTLNFTDSPTGEAFAKYYIGVANDDVGFWNITYNNTYAFERLEQALLSDTFDITYYSIACLNLPSFDGNWTNSKNWNIYDVISPSYVSYAGNAELFNYTDNEFNQSARILYPIEKGNWTIIGSQLNYIIGTQFNNSVFGRDIPIFYRDSYMKYNFSLLSDAINDYDGFYNISILDENGTMISSYPQYYSSGSQDLVGKIFLSESFKTGKYYITCQWNDTNNIPGRTLRFGSVIAPFRIYNATYVGFINTTTGPIEAGILANFSLYYRVNYTGNWGINTTTALVYENSSGNYKLWGMEWTGTYQVITTYLGDGNYTFQLKTSGVPNGNYSLRFEFWKSFHQLQHINSSLEIKSNLYISLDISQGAYFDGASGKYLINPENVPYVNDTINSIIQLNLTETGAEAILGGIVYGTIGDTDVYFQAEEIYNQIPLEQNKGLYNLTLDTTYLNATLAGKNETLYISASADGYVSNETEIIIEIDPIPTTLELQNVQSKYEGGEISLSTTMNKYITPDNPKPVSQGSLEYYIFNESSSLQVKSGHLTYLMSGVYTETVSLEGLTGGDYFIFINASAFNCENATSNTVFFSIYPRDITQLSITLPEIIRISQEFDIKSTLAYINGTPISDQIVSLNITLEEPNSKQESVIVSTTTNGLGESYRRDFIISPKYEGGFIIVNATFEGGSMIGNCSGSNLQTILGKIPIRLNITEHPNDLARVGYSASYSVQINISDEGESLQNRIILFSAFYEDQSDNPFISTQLTTDINGETSYEISEIADGYDNLTVYFEFLGSTTISYNFTTRTDEIIPKWTSEFSYTPLAEDGVKIRFGQTLLFNMSFWSPENSEISFASLGVEFKFEYGSSIEIYTQYINSNDTLSFSYTIASNFETKLNITMKFLGSNQIQEKQKNEEFTVYDKIKLKINFVDEVQTQYHTGTQFISVLVTDEDDNPQESLQLIFELQDVDGNVVDTATSKSNEDGIASASLDFSDVGEDFKIRVSFAEEGIYAASELESEEPIRIVNDFILFLDMLPYIGIAAAIVAGIWLSIYRGYIIPKRNRERAFLKKMYQKLSDVENIQYVLILTKDGGVPVFSKSLAEVPIDESLVSGFLSAISTFGEEIGSKMKDKKSGGLEELSYRQFKIILHEGEYVRVALLLLRRPSNSLKQKLRNFVSRFEEINEQRLQKYTGEIFADMAVTKIIEEVFEADLLYPHQVVDSRVPNYTKNLSRKDLARKIIITATGEEFESNFYLRDMINHLKTKGIEEIKSFEKLETMKEDQVVFAINPRTNYLIEQLQPFIKMLDKDDRKVLGAIFAGATNEMSIRKYLKKQKIDLSKEISEALVKLYELEIIDSENRITDTGSAIATLLELIPDL